MSSVNVTGLGRASRFWGVVLLISAVLLSPFYLYESGFPQPAHVVMLLASLIILGLNRKACVEMLRLNWAGTAFLLLVTLINLSYAIYHQDKSFVVNIIYWIYGYILMAAVIYVACDVFFGKWAKSLILFKLALIVFAYFVGWGGYSYWPRYEYFFNGPNQLAYFAICMLLVYLSITQGRLSIGFFCAYGLTLFVVVTTGGRSAYLALLPLLILLLWLARSKLKQILLLLAIPVMVNLAFHSLCLPHFNPGLDGNRRIACVADTAVSSSTVARLGDLTANKEVVDNNSVWVQLMARGYMRLVHYPHYLLYGAGQGGDARFGTVGGYVYEIHSSVAAVLFYYGLAGLFLFSVFIWKMFRSKINLLFLSPLVVYGLFTYGLRSPYFWITLAFLSTMPNFFNSEEAQSNV